MQNKKLGIILLIIGIFVSIVLIKLVMDLNQEAQELGCFKDDKCMQIESSLDVSHLAFGVIGFVLALAFYLIVFSRTDQIILNKLENENKLRSDNERFELILKGLDSYERKVMNIIKENEGITQNTLQIKSGVSKAKLSYVLQDLEKKDLIKRITKGKTLAVYLK